MTQEVVGRPELREKIRGVIRKSCQYLQQAKCPIKDNLACAWCERELDQILAFFPNIELAKREERRGIGLQIQQQWSKATSAKDYSPYKLVDFLGDIITKLNKGQALKGEK